MNIVANTDMNHRGTIQSGARLSAAIWGQPTTPSFRRAKASRLTPCRKNREPGTALPLNRSAPFLFGFPLLHWLRADAFKVLEDFLIFGALFSREYGTSCRCENIQRPA